MNRAELLAKAADIVTHDRQATHGRPEESFVRIALLWSAYLDFEIAPHDVTALMALLKLARVRVNPGHVDNWLDLAGYAACGAELNDGTPAREPAPDDLVARTVRWLAQ